MLIVVCKCNVMSLRRPSCGLGWFARERERECASQYGNQSDVLEYQRGNGKLYKCLLLRSDLSLC